MGKIDGLTRLYKINHIKKGKKDMIQDMSLLTTMSLLDMLNEGGTEYQKKYKDYVLGHKQRVKEFADWLKKNLPEVFEGVDMDSFDELIDEHDESKFSVEEFDAYAKHFYCDDDYSLEYDSAWGHHWTNNEHHPEHWGGRDIPYIYILELLCDWGSFSIAKGDFNELISYYYEDAKDDDEKDLSPNTKKTIENILSKISSIV